MSPYSGTMGPWWLLTSPGITAIAVLGSPCVRVSCIFRYMRGKGQGFWLEKPFVLMDFMTEWLICRP